MHFQLDPKKQIISLTEIDALSGKVLLNANLESRASGELVKKLQDLKEVDGILDDKKDGYISAEEFSRYRGSLSVYSGTDLDLGLLVENKDKILGNSTKANNFQIKDPLSARKEDLLEVIDNRLKSVNEKLKLPSNDLFSSVGFQARKLLNSDRTEEIGQTTVELQKEFLEKYRIFINKSVKDSSSPASLSGGKKFLATEFIDPTAKKDLPNSPEDFNFENADPNVVFQYAQEINNNTFGTDYAKLLFSGNLLLDREDIDYTYKSGTKAKSSKYSIQLKDSDTKIQLILPKKDNQTPFGEYVSVIAPIISEIRKLPLHLQKVTNSIVLDPKDNPDDAYLAKTKKIPDFKSAATAGTGETTFYQNRSYIYNSNALFHETGHNIQNKLNISDSTWEKAKKADNNSISKYGDTSLKEDFADSFAEFAQAKIREGTYGISNDIKDFKDKHPHRYALLEKVWNNQYYN